MCQSKKVMDPSTFFDISLHNVNEELQNDQYYLLHLFFDLVILFHLFLLFQMIDAHILLYNHFHDLPQYNYQMNPSIAILLLYRQQKNRHLYQLGLKNHALHEIYIFLKMGQTCIHSLMINIILHFLQDIQQGMIIFALSLYLCIH